MHRFTRSMSYAIDRLLRRGRAFRWDLLRFRNRRRHRPERVEQLEFHWVRKI
jgi:hypothetical protein